MNFRQRITEQCLTAAYVAKMTKPDDKAGIAMSVAIGRFGRDAIEVRFPGAQSIEFFDHAHIETQDFIGSLRSPFKKLWIAHDSPVSFSLLTEQSKMTSMFGASVEIGPSAMWRATLIVQLQPGDEWKLDPGVVRVFLVFPLGETTSGFMMAKMARFEIMSDNKMNLACDGDHSLRSQMYVSTVAWAIHVLNFLNSPSVALVRKEPDARLVKKQARKGRPVSTGWYEIEWRHMKYESSAHGATGRHVGFRFDVRGHFKHFKVGKMAGRVCWCRPHQRGLANTIYRPKGYRVKP